MLIFNQKIGRKLEISLSAMQREELKRGYGNGKQTHLTKPQRQTGQKIYEVRHEMLGLLEKQSEAGQIDLFYADQSQVSESG